LSESKLYHKCWVSQVKVVVMPYYRWGCFLYQNRVIIRVRLIVRVRVIVRVSVIVRVRVIVTVRVNDTVKDILCTLDLPSVC